MNEMDFGCWLNWLESGFVADGRSDSLVQAAAGLTERRATPAPSILGMSVKAHRCLGVAAAKRRMGEIPYHPRNFDGCAAWRDDTHENGDRPITERKRLACFSVTVRQ